MDAAQALYEQIDRRITKLEDKVDPLLDFISKEKEKIENRKERIISLRDFVSVSISGSIAALVSYLFTKGH